MLLKFALLAVVAAAAVAPVFAQFSRLPAVQQGIVQVRLRPGYSPAALRQTLPSAVARAMLLPEQSLTYNPRAIARTVPANSAHLTAVRLSEEPVLRTFTVEYGTGESPGAVCKRLAANPAVEIAEPKYIERTLGQPDDPDLGKQTYLTVIRAFEAWDIFPGDTNVVIGICDNGILKTHEDLSGNIARNWGEIPGNRTDDDGNGYIDDFDGVNLATFAEDGSRPGETFVQDGHGTNVAGVAGATVNNATGIAGTGGRCRIFPIKAGRVSEQGIYRGYEGIIYAATRGFAVVNCSWGTPNAYSELNESVIQFALSRGTAVVAAGGNDGVAAPVYPAAYRGVLGVGETDAQDRKIGASAYGAHVRIMTPGHRAWTTTNGGGYEFFDGTSSASPIAAALVAMIRAKYPALDATQAVEFARLCGDDIRASNPFTATMIPLRANMLTAMQRDPFSTPALSPVAQQLSVRGLPAARLQFGDTATLTLSVKNYLGKAAGVRFELSQPDIFQPFILVDSIVETAEIAAGATAEIGPFRVVVAERRTSNVMLRFDVEANDDYRDFFLLPVIPTSDVTTFQNDAIALTAADGGSLGYAGDGSSLRGGGLLVKPYQNLLPVSDYSGYTTALVATADGQKVVAAFPAWSEFGARKSLIPPDENVAVMVDSLADLPENRIGLSIRATYLVNRGSLPVVAISLKATNENDAPVQNPALGYFFDWDVGRYGEDNRVRLYPEGASGITGAAAAMAAWREGPYPYVGVGVQSDEPGAIPQAAGLDRSDVFEQSSGVKAELYAFLNNGTVLQYSGAGDIAMAAGMKFPGELAPGASKECRICIAASVDEDDMRFALLQCMAGNVVSADGEYNSENSGNALRVWPQPAAGVVRFGGVFRAENGVKIGARLLDGLGRVARVCEVFSDGREFTGSLDAAGLPAGLYRLQIAVGREMLSAPVAVVR